MFQQDSEKPERLKAIATKCEEVYSEIKFFFSSLQQFAKAWYNTHEQSPALCSLQLNHNHGSAKIMDSSGQQLLQHARLSAAETDQM